MALTNEVQILVTAEVDKAIANIKKLPGETGKASKGVGKSLSNMKMKFLALGAGIFASVKAFGGLLKVTGDFEQAIANVASVSGGATDELAKLARQSGKDTVFSATQAAEALYFLASAGVATEDMAVILTPTLNFAAAAQIGLAEATDLVVNQLKIYGAKMSDATEFTDVMAKTVSSSNTNMTQLGEALSYSSSIANQVGVPFKKLNALLGLMGDRGIKATRAGTQVRQMFARLVKPTAAAKKVLAKYNITQDQLTEGMKDPVKLFKLLQPAVQNSAEATEIFGVRQQDVIGIIKSGIQPLEALTEKINNAGGAAKKMADVQIDTLQGSLKLLQSAFQELILSVGGEGGMGDVFRSIVEVLISVVRGFSKLPTWVKTTTIAIAALLPVVIALVTVLNPVGAVILGVGVALGALVGTTAYLSGSTNDLNEELESLEKITTRLRKSNKEYSEIVKQLTDKNIKLTGSQRAVLENRKKLLSVQMQGDFLKLAKAINREENISISNKFKIQKYEKMELNYLADKKQAEKELSAYHKLSDKRKSVQIQGAKEYQKVLKEEYNIDKSIDEILQYRDSTLKRMEITQKNTLGLEQSLVNYRKLNQSLLEKNAKSLVDMDEATAIGHELIKSGYKTYEQVEAIIPGITKKIKKMAKEEKDLNGEIDKTGKGRKRNIPEIRKTAEALFEKRKEIEKEIKKVKESYEAYDKLSKSTKYSGATKERFTENAIALKVKLDELNESLEEENNKLKGISESTDEIAGKYAGMSDAIGVFDSKLGSNIGNITKAKEEFSEMNNENSNSIQKFAGMASIVGAIITLIAELGGKIKDAGKGMQEFANTTNIESDKAKAGLTGLGRVLEGFGGVIEAGKDGLGGFIKYFKGHYDKRTQIIEDHQTQVEDMEEQYLADQLERTLAHEMELAKIAIDTALEASLKKLDLEHEYTNILKAEEEERYKNMTEAEKKKYDAQKDYEQKVEDLKKEAEKKKEAIQLAYDIAKFERDKRSMLASAKMNKALALAQAEGILGRKKRNSAKDEIKSAFDEIEATIKGLTFYAKGGRNIPGGMSVVGEQGAELVNLPKGSDVYNNTESKQMTRNNNQNFAGANFDMTGVKDKEMFMQWMAEFAEDRGVSI